MDATHVVIASGTLTSGYDDNLLAEARGSDRAFSGNDPQLRGAFGGGFGSLAYTLRSQPFTVGVSGGTSARYYPSLERRFVYTHQGQANVDGSLPLRRGLSLTLGANITYRPYLLDRLYTAVLQRDPADASVADLDVPYRPDSYIRHSERVGLSQEIGRRTTLTGNYDFQGTLTSGSNTGRTFQRQSVGARLTRNISSGFSVRAGYTHSETTRADDRVELHEIIDIGADYNRPLSFSRRTTLSFGSGSSAMTRDDRRRFLITGNVQLTHEIGRTWTAWGGYNRRFIDDEIFEEPLSQDGVTAGVSGLITRRLQFTATARKALGKVSIRIDAPDYDNAQGAASVQFSVNRFASLGATYSYYEHQFDEGTILAAGLPLSVRRQSFRVGLSLWAPIYQQGRRANATR